MTLEEKDQLQKRLLELKAKRLADSTEIMELEYKLSCAAVYLNLAKEMERSLGKSVSVEEAIAFERLASPIINNHFQRQELWTLISVMEALNKSLIKKPVQDTSDIVDPTNPANIDLTHT